MSRTTIAKFQSLAALAVMVLAMAVLSENFLTPENGWNILRQISVNLCLSLGMTLVVLTGGIDLSVGAILALAGAVAAGLLRDGLRLPRLGIHLEFTVFGAMLAAVATGLALGCFNGMAVTRFKLPPFIATLGMMSIARGFTMLWTGGRSIGGLSDAARYIGNGVLLRVPMPVWVLTALTAVFVVVTRRMRFGRYVYAVGSNERAALLSGLPVNRVKLRVYMLAGGLAGIAGLIQNGRVGSAQPDAGVGYELDSIAAVVIGGTSLSGGRGSVMGTVIGCLIIGVLNNALALLGVNAFWQLVVKGFVILAAVAVDRATARQQ